MKIVNGTFNNCTFTVNDETGSNELLKLKEQTSAQTTKGAMELVGTLAPIIASIATRKHQSEQPSSTAPKNAKAVKPKRKPAAKNPIKKAAAKKSSAKKTK
jgi:hypothetical protein